VLKDQFLAKQFLKEDTHIARKDTHHSILNILTPEGLINSNSHQKAAKMRELMLPYISNDLSKEGKETIFKTL